MSDTPKTDAKEKAYWSNPTSHVDDVWTWAQELERENAALREVLAFYADPQSYGINGGNFHRVASDHGLKARAALARKEAQS